MKPSQYIDSVGGYSIVWELRSINKTDCSIYLHCINIFQNFLYIYIVTITIKIKIFANYIFCLNITSQYTVHALRIPQICCACMHKSHPPSIFAKAWCDYLLRMMRLSIAHDQLYWSNILSTIILMQWQYTVMFHSMNTVLNILNISTSTRSIYCEGLIIIVNNIERVQRLVKIWASFWREWCITSYWKVFRRIITSKWFSRVVYRGEGGGHEHSSGVMDTKN